MQHHHLIVLLCLASPADWRVEHAEGCLLVEDPETMKELEARKLIAWEVIREVDQLSRCVVTPKGQRVVQAALHASVHQG